MRLPIKNTYTEHYATLDHYFGLHQHLTMSHRKLSQVFLSLNEEIEHGYTDLPENLWTNATWENKPITRMFYKENNVSFGCLPGDYFLYVITRD